jgi:hypothetical protein
VGLHQIEQVVQLVVLSAKGEALLACRDLAVERIVGMIGAAYLEGGISLYLQGTLASWQPWHGCPPSHFDFLLRQFSHA